MYVYVILTSDICFKCWDVYVLVEIEVLFEQFDHTLEFGPIRQNDEHVKRVDKRERITRHTRQEIKPKQSKARSNQKGDQLKMPNLPHVSKPVHVIGLSSS